MANALKVVRRQTTCVQFGRVSPYADNFLCRCCGWIPKLKAVATSSGFRCPYCNQRLRTKSKNKSRPEYMRAWRLK